MKLGKRQPSTPIKFAIGIILAGLSFLVMVLPVMGGSGELVSPLWLVLSFLLVVLGELCLSLGRFIRHNETCACSFLSADDEYVVFNKRLRSSPERKSSRFV
ncbi:POT-type proton-dependent oligopeptide transporter [Bacillus velezensis]